MNLILKSCWMYFAIISFVCCVHKNERIVKKFPNGSIHVESDQVDGKLNGITKIYYQNGRLEEIGSWSNNKAHGRFIKYDSTGRIMAINNFRNGKREDTCYQYRADSPIKIISVFKDDLLRSEMMIDTVKNFVFYSLSNNKEIVFHDNQKLRRIVYNYDSPNRCIIEFSNDGVLINYKMNKCIPTGNDSLLINDSYPYWKSMVTTKTNQHKYE